jgi:hypothetical protein
MKITLELEDTRFVSTSGELGDTRWLIVELAGKKFYVTRKIENEFIYNRRDTRNAIDKLLVESMQLMLEALLYNGAVAQPDGEVQTRCATGELWRYHYERKCRCGKEAIPA